MDGNSAMPFGKHRGTPLRLVPAAYLVWLEKNSGGKESPLMEYIRWNINELKERAKRDSAAHFRRKAIERKRNDEYKYR